ncbi:hypothetical protein [Paraburkholderia bannensis]|uniref:hypothetical protein n=1 Tax=Paraburkholderia bannensis TaxID=765414 RepID=UPI002ABE387E|nr:hypothetical protein [Paraburkholderia bannensis]
MKRLASIVLLTASINVWAQQDPQIDNPGQISAFLSSPGVKNFDYPDPKTWKSFRKYIQIGTKMPDGSCRLTFDRTTPSDQPFIQKEIAVDRAGCRSLMLEGVPDDATEYRWQKMQEVIHQHAKSTELKDPGIGKKLSIKQGADRQVLLKQEAVTTDATTTVASTGGDFNTGGTTYIPSYSIQYTDGNNPVMKQGLVGLVTTLSSLLNALGIQIGEDGILAAEVDVSQSYGTPTVSPISDNCFYDSQAVGSSVQLAQYGGTVQYKKGSADWAQTSENACSAMSFAVGNVANTTAVSSNTPGQALGAPASADCIAAAKASFNNSCAQYGSQIQYVETGYYTDASGTFYNNSKLSFFGQTVFDCTAAPGLTINFNDMKIVSDGAGHSTITGTSDYNGPQSNCSEYLSRTISYMPNATASSN